MTSTIKLETRFESWLKLIRQEMLDQQDGFQAVALIQPVLSISFVGSILKSI